MAYGVFMVEPPQRPLPPPSGNSADGVVRWTPAGWPTDPVEVLAHVYALRQVADLGGFPHVDEWERIEADAARRISRQVDRNATPIDLRSAPAAADPMAAFVSLSAARIAADEAGMAHAPEWDRTEETVREELSQPHPGSTDQTNLDAATRRSGEMR